MDINHTNNFKPQLFISTTAWVFIILTSTALYFSITNLIVFKIGFQMQQELFQELTDSANQAITNVQNIWQTIWLFMWVAMLSSLALLIASINLLKRKNWARILFTIVCILIALLLVAFGFYMKYQYGEARNLMNFNLEADTAWSKMQLATQIQLVAYLIFIVAVAWCMIRILIKLNSKKMREYFQ